MLRGVILTQLCRSRCNQLKTIHINDAYVAGIGSKTTFNLVLAASYHYDKAPVLYDIPNYDDVEFPHEKRRLHVMERQPVPPAGRRPQKMTKQLRYIRGPELIHNKLIHKQYGIRALQGGQLKNGHLDVIRNGVNRKMDEKRMFAIWRIDPVWKPITKKGQGHRMGGGKGAIDHYVTPVKAGRIIIEVGGNCEYNEVYPFLKRIAAKLPFKAEAISQEYMEAQEEEEARLKKLNLNPFSFEYCLKNNFMGSRSWASPYDYIWHGKYS